jgi:hypothetical protein
VCGVIFWEREITIRLQEISSCLNAFQTCRLKHKLLNVQLDPRGTVQCCARFSWEDVLVNPEARVLSLSNHLA